MAAGMSGREASKHFSIGEATALRWIRRMRDMGSPQAKPMGGKRPFALEAHRSRIITRLAEKPDLTLLALLAELKALGATASSYALWSIVANAGLSFKKRMARPVRKQFLRYESCQSASTYPACGHCPGQDGDPRVPVLIKLTASERHFLNQGARTPV
jgi:transposase